MHRYALVGYILDEPGAGDLGDLGDIYRIEFVLSANLVLYHIDLVLGNLEPHVETAHVVCFNISNKYISGLAVIYLFILIYMSYQNISGFSPRSCIGSPYTKFVKTFAGLNFQYGLISLTFSVRWGRYVLLYIKIQTSSGEDVVEYYAVAIGLLCFILGAISLLLLDAKDAVKRKHMSIQMVAWGTWSVFAIYYTSTVVERTAAGTIHILLSIMMCIMAGYTRHEIDLEIKRRAIDEEGMVFSQSAAVPVTKPMAP